MRIEIAEYTTKWCLYVHPQLDDYSYDSLNRITSVTEAQLNSSGAWTFNLFTQNFLYDRWGCERKCKSDPIGNIKTDPPRSGFPSEAKYRQTILIRIR
ncbi:MAG: hypothetical protein AB7H86_18825 [Blastocatellales bacterium]